MSEPPTPPPGEEMPVAAFAAVFLTAPILLAVVIVAVQRLHGFGDSALSLFLVIGHLVAGAGFVAFYLFYRRSRSR